MMVCGTAHAHDVITRAQLSASRRAVEEERDMVTTLRAELQTGISTHEEKLVYAQVGVVRVRPYVYTCVCVSVCVEGGGWVGR
jgi:hypothetical protein